MGVHRSYLSYIFHGRRWPSLQVGGKIAEVLGVSLDELHAHLQHLQISKREKVSKFTAGVLSQPSSPPSHDPGL